MQPGNFMVTPTNGFVAWVIRWCTHSTVNHAAIYIGGGQIVEAQAKGAVISPVKNYPNAIWSDFTFQPGVESRLYQAAMDVVGTPYNFLDIAAQALVRIFHWKAPKWALRRVSDPRSLQCAQLVDVVYQRAGITLFPDGRPNGLVAPSDLLVIIERQQHGKAERQAA